MRYRLITLLLAGSLTGVWSVGAIEGADLANGKKVYADKCARCHGVSGKGDGPKAETLEKKPTDYTDKKKMGEITDAQLKKIVQDGKPPMPGYKKTMNDRDLEDVIAYIRSLAGK